MTNIEKTSLNIKEEKLSELKKILPNVFTENKLDIDKINSFFNSEHKNSSDERYNFTWAGKKESFLNLQNPAKGTLRPDKNKSINFDEKDNIFIEGDNLEVLKLLQKSYFNKIKMIYIDPPYNTGKDFVYKDNFKNSIKSYLEQTGQIDENGNKLTTNNETNGRFHSDWLSMMYPRLFLARNLMSDDGVIFISIDDSEVHNLKMICNEIFGEENFVAQLVRKTRSGGGYGNSDIGIENDYILAYTKNREKFRLERVKKDKKEIEKYFNKKDENGPYHSRELKQSDNQEGYRENRPYMFYPFYIKKDKLYIIERDEFEMIYQNNKFNEEYIKELEKKYENLIFPIRSDGKYGRWTCGYEKALEMIKDNNLEKIGRKIYKKERIDEDREGKVATSLLVNNDYSNTKGSDDLKEIFNSNSFDFPKPVTLIKYLIQLSTSSDDDIVLDFFAGSGTTAQSVLEYNNDEKKNLKFICVQLPEPTAKDSTARKEGYETISQISRERIKRVIEKIDVGEGFKFFRLDKSNYKIWEDIESNSTEELEKQLKLFNEPLIKGYDKEDVIYELIIKEGYSLNSDIEITKVGENNFFKVSDNNQKMYISFDNEIKKSSIESIKQLTDSLIVLLESAIDDSLKINISLECRLKTI